MRRRTAWVAVAVATLVFAVVVGSAAGKPAAGKPIVIGAAVDLTKNMAPFDAPALGAAQAEIAKINAKGGGDGRPLHAAPAQADIAKTNAKGGVDGRPLQLKFINTQLDPNKTKQAAATLLGQGVDIGWVTCDVDFATPAWQTFLQAKKLTVSPCIGTDEMSPLRFS